MRESICVSACALAAMAGSADAQTTWQFKSRLDVTQVQNIYHVDGTGEYIGQMEYQSLRRSHEVFAAAGGGDRVAFSSFTNAGGLNNDHPTRVASIMAGKSATYTGAAPGTLLQCVDIFNTPTVTLSEDFLAKMRFLLLAPSAPIINMSASRPLTNNDPGNASSDTERAEFQRIADWSVEQGTLFVCTPGNVGPGAHTARSPGTGYNVLTVGATGDTNATGSMVRNWDQVGAFSSRGTVDQGWSGGVVRHKPDLVAPGANIFSAQGAADNSYGTTAPGNNEAATGTSFAAPQVSGAGALLRQLGGNNPDAKDSRVLRSILMNSTNKTVRDDATAAGTRWDELGLGRGATNTSDSLGTGRLDALAAARQMAAGQARPTFGTGANFDVDSAGTGWDKGTLNGVGENNSNSYRTNTDLRKGSYIVSTLAWNRHMAVRNGGAAPSDFGYDAMNNLDLGVSKFGAIGTILQRSNSVDDAREHLVYKVGNADADRTKYYVRAWQTSHDSVTQADEQYGLAWRSVPAPLAAPGGTVGSYNGNFSPGLGAPVDDGWYKTVGTPRIGEKPWDTIDATYGRMDSTYAMELKPDDIMAQELTTPDSFFDITFTYGFTNAGGMLKVLLGGINLLEFDNVAGDTIDSGALSLNMSATYTGHVDLLANPEIWAAMWGGGFTELGFQGMGAGLDYVDNITYIPAPGTVGILALLALAPARRRR